jgi:two-component system OmpR family response regulator
MRSIHRILVVDDDLSILDLLTSVLRDEGYDVLPAAGGAQALVLARTQRVDCMLLDMRMPDVSGQDVARELRSEGRHFPIIIVSASPDAGDFAREIGAAGFIEKPFAITDVTNAVERYCRPSRPVFAHLARKPPLPA